MKRLSCGGRTFRLDRLVDVVPTGARFRPREVPGGDAAQYVRANLASGWRHEVELVVQAPAAHAERSVGRWATVEPDGPRTCRLRLETDSFDWVVLLVAAVGADVRVVSPDGLAEHLRSAGERLLRAGL